MTNFIKTKSIILLFCIAKTSRLTNSPKIKNCTRIKKSLLIKKVNKKNTSFIIVSDHLNQILFVFMSLCILIKILKAFLIFLKTKL
jgi:hypothetical protein